MIYFREGEVYGLIPHRRAGTIFSFPVHNIQVYICMNLMIQSIAINSILYTLTVVSVIKIPT